MIVLVLPCEQFEFDLMTLASNLPIAFSFVQFHPVCLHVVGVKNPATNRVTSGAIHLSMFRQSHFSTFHHSTSGEQGRFFGGKSSRNL